MHRKIITTKDGSKTIQIEEWDEVYHSKHGAIQEAQYVYIEKGLHHFIETNGLRSISILEMGFGTGLNSFLTLLEGERLNLIIKYHGVEAYPISQIELNHLNYVDLLSPDNNKFNEIHEVIWEQEVEISTNFKLVKRQQFFSKIKDDRQFNLIYFDAFGSRVQPELWSKDMFSRMYQALKPKGVLVTYAAIGVVKRHMIALGFIVERLNGPPGKRHMLRATKPE